MIMQVADPDIKKAGFVTKWLGYGAQMLGPVKRKDGTTVEREIQTWLPKKKVKAYSLRCESFQLKVPKTHLSLAFCQALCRSMSLNE